MFHSRGIDRPFGFYLHWKVHDFHVKNIYIYIFTLDDMNRDVLIIHGAYSHWADVTTCATLTLLLYIKYNQTDHYNVNARCSLLTRHNYSGFSIGHSFSFFFFYINFYIWKDFNRSSL